MGAWPEFLANKPVDTLAEIGAYEYLWKQPNTSTKKLAQLFEQGEFDVAWSIWVLEHVPNPEAALVEMRRVVKNDGLLYLFPAWDCTPFAASGYNVRPYSDFGVAGKLEKASMPLRTSVRHTARTFSRPRGTPVRR